MANDCDAVLIGICCCHGGGGGGMPYTERRHRGRVSRGDGIYEVM